MNTDRYSRQTILPEIANGGQKCLARARVLCIGAGGLGSPAALYLAAAGVGTIGLIDPDTVELSNLQRQILFSTEDQGLSKVQAGQKRLQNLNPEIDVRPYAFALTRSNAETLFRDYDLILDGSDNFETRFLVNDTSCRLGIPWVYGAVDRFEGQVAIFWGERGPCYRCLYPRTPQADIRNCAAAGVLGSVVGTAGTLQATLALQFLISGGDPTHPLYPTLGELTFLDFKGSWKINRLTIDKNTNCPSCSTSQGQSDGRPRSQKPAVSSGASAPTPAPAITTSSELIAALASKDSDILLLDVRETSEWDEGHLPGAIHCPLQKIENESLPFNVSYKQSVIIYCTSSMRSNRAASLLIKQGFESVQTLQKGIMGWPGPISHDEL